MANEEPASETYSDGTPILVDLGLELALAIGRALAEQHGPEFGRKAKRHWDENQARMLAKGGDGAAYSRAAAAQLDGFDWEVFKRSPSSSDD